MFERRAAQGLEIRDLRRDRRQLLHWLQATRAAFDELLRSKRWRVGNWLGSAWCRLRGLKSPATAADAVRDTLARFQAWYAAQAPGTVPDFEILARLPFPEFRQHGPVDIVVCVHNALAETQACLAALQKYTSEPYRLLLIDDGSDPPTAAFLQHFAARATDKRVELVRRSGPPSYTRAANLGLSAANAAHVVLLNSDTEVGPGWLDLMLEVAARDPAIGLVGPLSNAASWQSAPEVFSPSGSWAINSLPEGIMPAAVARALACVAPRKGIRVPLLNGFCLLLTRAVIERVGLFDAEAFPQGYGEETDYEWRAAEAGFTLAVAEAAYVFHAKSRSFGDERRRELCARASERLAQRWGSERLAQSQHALANDECLAKARQRVGELLRSLAQRPQPAAYEHGGPNAGRGILFLLPVKPGGGGVHSVVQEACAMHDRGVPVRLAIPAHQEGAFHEHYPRAACAGLFAPFSQEAEVCEWAAAFRVAVATVSHSTRLLLRIVRAHSRVRPAYYVQDYEPLFYTPRSPAWHEAVRSYTLVPGAVLFAKTEWICREVERRHRVRVRRVPPGLDHDVFFPAYERAAPGHPLVLAAMIRPQTPRRGAPRTLALLRSLVHQRGEQISVQLFGCRDEELARCGVPLDFAFTNRGPLVREQVACVLRASDLFCDLSDYQAFGRTALEAMACGCVPVAPRVGAAPEFVRHLENGLLVETGTGDRLPEASRAPIDQLLDAPRGLRPLRGAALATAAGFSVAQAVAAELEVLLGDSAESFGGSGFGAGPGTDLPATGAAAWAGNSHRPNGDELPILTGMV